MQNRSPLFDAVSKRYRSKSLEMEDRGGQDEPGELAPDSGGQVLPGAESVASQDGMAEASPIADSIYDSNELSPEEKAALLRQLGDPRADEFESFEDEDEEMLMGDDYGG